MKFGKTKCPLIAQVRGDKRLSIKNITLINHWNLILNIRKSRNFSSIFLSFQNYCVNNRIRYNIFTALNVTRFFDKSTRFFVKFYFFLMFRRNAVLSSLVVLFSLSSLAKCNEAEDLCTSVR